MSVHELRPHQSPVVDPSVSEGQPELNPDLEGHELSGNAAMVDIMRRAGTGEGAEEAGPATGPREEVPIEQAIAELQNVLEDRELARDELADRFQIVDGEESGDRAHNQVTAEEYERIVATYSDIRLGRGDLTVETSDLTDPSQRDSFMSGTMDAVADIMMTSSGREMIYQLSDNVMVDDEGNERHFGRENGERVDVTGTPQAEGLEAEHRHTTIRAFHQDQNRNGYYDDDPQGEANYQSENAEACAPNVRDRSMIGQPGVLNDNNSRFRQADGSRGTGTDANVWWAPNSSPGDVAAEDSDVILLHELAHALHSTQGTNAGGTYRPADGAGPDAGRVPNNERQAVGLSYEGQNPGDPNICTENDYRRERNELGDNFVMRDSYSGRQPGRAPESPDS